MLEVSGSPGAHHRLHQWVRAVLEHRLDNVGSVEVQIAGANGKLDTAGQDLAGRITAALANEISPGLAEHEGRVDIAVAEASPNTNAPSLEIRFGGRCQGCAMCEVTLRQGIEPILRRVAPELGAIVDRTDHNAGANPYFPTGKGGHAG